MELEAKLNMKKVAVFLDAAPKIHPMYTLNPTDFSLKQTENIINVTKMRRVS